MIIRDNEDYYVSIGYRPEEARKLAYLDENGNSFCNPMKIKIMEEEIKEDNK